MRLRGVQAIEGQAFVRRCFGKARDRSGWRGVASGWSACRAVGRGLASGWSAAERLVAVWLRWSQPVPRSRGKTHGEVAFCLICVGQRVPRRSPICRERARNMATQKCKIQTEEVKKTENRKRQKWNDRKKGKKVLCCGTEELRVFGEENVQERA